MTEKFSEGPLASNGSQPCSMGDREREEISRVVERCGREGDGGGTRETWDPKMATEASLEHHCKKILPSSVLSRHPV